MASLLEPKTFEVRIGPCNHIWVTAEWCSYIHPEIKKIEPKGWGNSILIEDLPENGLFTLNFSKLKEFDKQVMAVFDEADRQAKDKGVDAGEYFDDVLKEAEDIS
jgi:hypothetical protein